MKTMKDYHNLYLKCDVLLFTDVLEKFRNKRIMVEYYQSAPALNWVVILNMTKVELELMLDADMYLFFEEGIRHAVSYISKIFSKAILNTWI